MTFRKLLKLISVYTLLHSILFRLKILIIPFFHYQLGSVVGASTKQHTKRVTCVRWVRPTPCGGCLVVSGGADGKAVLWTVAKEKTENLFVLHPSSVLGN